MKLSSKLGDTNTFRIPLSWGNDDFSPGANYTLTFTLKSDVNDLDAAAIVQKSTGGLGIEIDGSFADLTILRSDTFRDADYPNPGDPAYQTTAGTYYWDIQADGIGDFDGDTRTVATGIFVLSRDITRGVGPSIPIYTTDPPSPSTVSNTSVNAAIETDPAATGASLGLGPVATSNDYNDLDNLPTGGDFLPLTGGTMESGADIIFANASAIREAGAQGLEIECSVGYRWQWVAGRMILRQVNSGQIARIIAIDEINPAATDDETQGFVIGTRWETINGTIYECTDATTDDAVWVTGGTLGTAAFTDSTAYATAAQGTLADGAAQKSLNLSDLASASTARTNLGLGTLAIAKMMVPCAFTTRLVDTQIAATSTSANDGQFCRQALSNVFSIEQIAATWENNPISNTGTPGVGGVGTPIARIAVRAALEYPAGTYHPLSFNGNRDCVIAPGMIATCDPYSIKIPANTTYYIRTVVVAVGANTLAGLSKNFYSSNTGALTLSQTGLQATAATTQTGGAIYKVISTQSGSGYPPNTQIACTVGGGGSNASITANINAAGMVEDYTIIARGTGYSNSTLTVPGNKTGAIINGSAILTDQTLRTGGETTTTFVGYGASAVLGMPAETQPNTYLALGDSITEGSYDTTSSFGGWPIRVSSSKSRAIINTGDSGLMASTGYADASKCWDTLRVGDACSHAIVLLGSNDLNNSRTDIQIIADLTRIIQRLQAIGKTVDLCTITPFANAANTAPKSFESYRVAVNTWIRNTSTSLGVRNIYDTADAMETSRNSGLWKTGYFSTNATDVGNDASLHPNATGYNAMTAAFSAID